jgi:hypothetical protein
MDKHVHTRLFSYIASYLDQGIGIWRMPHAGTADGLWATLRAIESCGRGGLFQGQRSHAYLMANAEPSLRDLMREIVN